MLHKFISTLCVEIKCGHMCYADAYTASVLCLNISIDATMSHIFINLADTQNPPHTIFTICWINTNSALWTAALSQTNPLSGSSKNSVTPLLPVPIEIHTVKTNCLQSVHHVIFFRLMCVVLLRSSQNKLFAVCLSCNLLSDV